VVLRVFSNDVARPASIESRVVASVPAAIARSTRGLALVGGVAGGARQRRLVDRAAGGGKQDRQPEHQRVHQVVGVQVGVEGEVGFVAGLHDQREQVRDRRVVGVERRLWAIRGPGTGEGLLGRFPAVDGVQLGAVAPGGRVHASDRVLHPGGGLAAGDSRVPGGDHLGGQVQQRSQVGDPVALLGAEPDLAALQVDIRLGDEPEQQQHHRDHQDL
jgi:hypothetical protein